MTRHARAAIALAAAAALGEAALLAPMTDWARGAPNVFLFGFLVGPPLFLALTAWRRRAHPVRARVLFVVAAAVALGGLGALGTDLYRFNTDPAFRRAPSMTRVLVPVVQWAVILVTWVWLVFAEVRDKRSG